MKRAFNQSFAILTFAVLAASTASAALPTLSGLADAIEEMRSGFASRLADTSNRLAQATEQIGTLWDALNETRGRISDQEEQGRAIVLLVEGDKGLRERWHGGRIGTYLVTNELGRLVSVDLYGDATAWTNGTSRAVSLPRDPEEAAKELARQALERERVQAAWEAANLPPDLAALRAAQREAARQQEGAE